MRPSHHTSSVLPPARLRTPLLVRQVLKQPALGAALTYAEMKDGVVAFEAAEDAASYATCYEADMDGEVRALRKARRIMCVWHAAFMPMAQPHHPPPSHAVGMLLKAWLHAMHAVLGRR